MRILFSGFEPFGEWPANPSAWAARAAATVAPTAMASLILPVEYDRAAGLLAEAVIEERATLVVALGMAGKREVVSVEARAVNRNAAELADNAGTAHAGALIDASGPDALTPQFPREDLIAGLASHGWPVEFSEDCGTFVCNNLFYRVGRVVGALANHPAFTFVHIPGPGVWDESRAVAFGRDLGAWANGWLQRHSAG